MDKTPSKISAQESGSVKKTLKSPLDIARARLKFVSAIGESNSPKSKGAAGNPVFFIPYPMTPKQVIIMTSKKELLIEYDPTTQNMITTGMRMLAGTLRILEMIFADDRPSMNIKILA